MHTCESNVFINLPLFGLHYPIEILKHFCLWLQALKLFQFLLLLCPIYTAMTQFCGGLDLLAEVHDADEHKRRIKERKFKVPYKEWVLPVTKKPKFDADFATIKEIEDFESAPRYQYAQGMVLVLTKEAAASLLQQFKGQDDKLLFYGGAQGVYWLVCFDKKGNGIWKQALEDLGGGPGRHGLYMQFNQTPQYNGWFLSKMMLKDGEQKGYGDGEIAGWFGNNAKDMSAPLHMPFNAQTALPGMQIVPFTEYIDKRICVDYGGLH